MSPDLIEFIMQLTACDKKSLSQKALKTAEEAGELAKRVLPYEGAHCTNHRFVTDDRILEECADVMLTSMSIAYHLGFTHEELVAMMLAKAKKWERLIAQDPLESLPYEIHITVTVPETESIESFTARFTDWCDRAQVKPVILDLHGQMNIKDVMTSHVHVGTNQTAYATAIKTYTALTFADFCPVRIKIETVPWHPAAPQTSTDIMPRHCYFECHVPLRIAIGDVDNARALCESLGMHMSANARKVYDGEMVYMATYRRNDTYYPMFQTLVDERVEQISRQYSLAKEKPHIEFSVYDTNVAHDSGWLDS